MYSEYDKENNGGQARRWLPIEHRAKSSSSTHHNMQFKCSTPLPIKINQRERTMASADSSFASPRVLRQSYSMKQDNDRSIDSAATTCTSKMKANTTVTATVVGASTQNLETPSTIHINGSTKCDDYCHYLEDDFMTLTMTPTTPYNNNNRPSPSSFKRQTIPSSIKIQSIKALSPLDNNQIRNMSSMKSPVCPVHKEAKPVPNRSSKLFSLQVHQDTYFKNGNNIPPIPSTHCNSETILEDMDCDHHNETSIEASIYKPQKKKKRCQNFDDVDFIENVEDLYGYSESDEEEYIDESSSSCSTSDVDDSRAETIKRQEDNCSIETNNHTDMVDTNSETETEEDDDHYQNFHNETTFTLGTSVHSSQNLENKAHNHDASRDTVEVEIVEESTIRHKGHETMGKVNDTNIICDSSNISHRISEGDEYSVGSRYDPATTNDTLEKSHEGTISKVSSSCSNPPILRKESTSLEKFECIPSKRSGVSRNFSIKRQNSIRRGKWTIGSKIGVGSFGVVYTGMNNCNGTLMAVKCLNLPSKSSSNEFIQDLQREIDVMRELCHNNIVRYLGAEMDNQKDVLHIFQEWVPGGSVDRLLKSHGPFPLAVIRSYLHQIFCGLDYLHKNHILHRDIKGGNVLVSDEGVVKLCDFGASKRMHISENGIGIEDMMESMTMRGTPYFMAPEVFEERYGPKADIWSVGCVLFQMITTYPPWKELGLKSPLTMFLHLQKHEGPPQFEYQEEYKNSSTLQSILETCFQRDPTKRPSTNVLMRHQFFSESNNNESIDDESTVFSIGLNKPFHLAAIKHPASPVAPISPKEIVEMKKRSKEKHAKKPLSRWPSWAKGSSNHNPDFHSRIKKDSICNPFAS